VNDLKKKIGDLDLNEGKETGKYLIVIIIVFLL